MHEFQQSVARNQYNQKCLKGLTSEGATKTIFTPPILLSCQTVFLRTNFICTILLGLYQGSPI